MEHSRFLVTSSPHIRSKDTIQSVMRDVVIALSPAVIMSVVYFGFSALLIHCLCVVSCVFFEFLYQKMTKKPITVYDFSAVITGLLLAMNMPASSPVWMPIVGSFFAIVIVKQLFGGLGQNFMNPALAARVFLVISFPKQMTDWSVVPPLADVITTASTVDGVTSATPLGLLKSGAFTPDNANALSAFLGKINGSIGETCVIALVIGGIYLLARKVINWRVPVFFIGGVFVFSWIFGRDGFFTGYPLYEILTGGVMLGAIFMATDFATSPVTPVGKIIMGLGCALITVLIRVYGNYPEGVSFAILLMNITVPLIDRFTRPRVYGEVRKHA